jgi:aspartate aminotransferase-like enzyme
MSSFGAIPVALDNVDFLVSSANKCLEGIPGFGYALCRKSKLALCKGGLTISIKSIEMTIKKACAGACTIKLFTAVIYGFSGAPL